MKKVVTLLLMFVLVIGISACGSDDASAPTDKTDETAGNETGSENESETSNDGEKTTITVWTEDRHNLDYVEAKVAEFNENNTSNIFIDYVVQADNFENMLLMSAASEQMPDIFKHVKDVKSFVDAGLVEPLDSYVTDEFKKVTNFDDVKYDGLNVIDGSTYYVPTGMRSGVRLIYNKEIFEKDNVEIPKTLDELVAAAELITEKGNGEEYGVVVPGQSAPAVRMFIPIAETSGILPYDYTIGQYRFDGYKPLMEAFKKMNEDGSMFPGSESMKVDPARVQFSEGNVGFYGNASQEAGVLTDQFPAKEEWGAAPMPSLDGEVKGTLTSSPNMGWMMSASSKKKEAAWEVINFFSSEEFIKGYVEAGYGLPIGTYMQGKVDIEKAGRLADFAPLAYEGVYPTFPEVTPEGKTYKDALWEACLVGGPDIDETITALNVSYNNALDKAVSIGKVKRLVIKDFDPMHPQAGTREYLEQ